MRDTEIIEALGSKLSVDTGRHLYGVLGSYKRLGEFTNKLSQAVAPDGTPFPSTLSVNKGILSSIPDAEFRELAENEAKRPEPTAAHVERAFESFLRANLKGRGLIVLGSLEMLFAYNVELTLLRTMAADDDRVLLLLPGRRSGGKVIMFPDLGEGYALPTNLIADNHMWELEE